MQFLTELFTSILLAYIAFTSSIADQIHSVFPDTDTENAAVEEVTQNDIDKLPSRYSGIPQILIENTDYQGAALIESEEAWRTTALGPLEALVNIFCTFTTDEYVRTNTGTGFFIHPDGVILTNAHVAQFLLLEATDEAGDTVCIARAGNPAVPAYELSLLYIPPTWIQEHAELIDDTDPSGTGERDYALLYVSSGVDGDPMPRVFPALAPDTTSLKVTDRDNTITMAGYPAGAFLTEGPEANLIPVLAESSISDFYTFSDNQADVLALRGSALGEQGSSGGPILSEAGEVIGMISTRGDDDADGEGSLRGISMDYINRTIEEETGFSLLENVGGDLPFRAKVFNDTLVPFLTQILVREI